MTDRAPRWARDSATRRASTVTPTRVRCLSSHVRPSGWFARPQGAGLDAAPLVPRGTVGMDRAHVGAGLGNERASTVTPTWARCPCLSSHRGAWDHGHFEPDGIGTSAEHI